MACKKCAGIIIIITIILEKLLEQIISSHEVKTGHRKLCKNGNANSSNKPTS